MKNYILFASLIAISFFGCKKEEQIPASSPVKVLDSIEIVTDTMSINITPFVCINVERLDSFYVIRDSIEYNRYLEHKSKVSLCDTLKLPKVDFNNYSVISYSIYTNGSPPPDVTRTVLKYKYEKRIVYQINLIAYHHQIRDDGPCQTIPNILRVPKIPADYTVQFDTTFKDVLLP